MKKYIAVVCLLAFAVGSYAAEMTIKDPGPQPTKWTAAGSESIAPVPGAVGMAVNVPVLKERMAAVQANPPQGFCAKLGAVISDHPWKTLGSVLVTGVAGWGADRAYKHYTSSSSSESTATVTKNPNSSASVTSGGKQNVVIVNAPGGTVNFNSGSQ